MAVVAGTPIVLIDNFNVFEALVPLTLSGSYPGSPAGDPVNLEALGVPSNSVPLFVDVEEQPSAGTAASGIVWRFAVGTTQANGALQAFVTGAASGDVLAPLGDTAYPAVAETSLIARVVFRKFL